MSTQYFDALAGASKTRALVSYAKQLARAGEQVLFAQPSKFLIDNTVLNEIGDAHSAYEVQTIHSGNSSDVVKTFMGKIARDMAARDGSST